VLLTAGSLNLTDMCCRSMMELARGLVWPNSFLDWNWMALSRCSSSLHFGACRGRTARLSTGGSGNPSSSPATCRISSTPFLLFFLGEYVAIVLMCALATILFLGGWLPPFDFAPSPGCPASSGSVLKVCFVFFGISM